MSNSEDSYRKKFITNLEAYEDDEKVMKDYRFQANFLIKKYDEDELSRNRSSEQAKITKLSLEQLIIFLERELEEATCIRERKFSILRKECYEEWQSINSLFKFEGSVTKDILLKPLNEDKLLEFIESSNSSKLNSHGTRIYSQLHDDIPCKICNDGDYFDEDLIVFCARCNVSVHQKCYGINRIPNDDWVCDLCRAFGPAGQYMPCPFCTKRGGAMKCAILTFRTNMFSSSNPAYHAFLQRTWRSRGNNLVSDIYKNRERIEGLYYDFQEICLRDENFELNQEPAPTKIWVHMTCSLWIPELIYEDKINCSKIKGFEKISKEKYDLECGECKGVNCGVSVKCYFPQCNVHFHPECARRGHCSLEIREVEKDPFVLYCQTHIPNKLIRGFENKENKAIEELVKFSKELTKTYEKFAREEKLENDLKREREQKEERNKISLRSDYNFLKCLCYILKQKPENQFIWEFTKPHYESNKSKLLKVHIPKKFYLKSNIPKSDPIWKQLSLRLNSSQNYFKNYKKFVIQRKERTDAEAKKIKDLKKKLRENFQKGFKFHNSEHSSSHLFCICQREYKEGEFMMGCENCDDWFHFDCIGFRGTLEDAEKIDYVCKKCENDENSSVKNERIERQKEFFTFPLNDTDQQQSLLEEDSTNEKKGKQISITKYFSTNKFNSIPQQKLYYKDQESECFSQGALDLVDDILKQIQEDEDALELNEFPNKKVKLD